MCAATMPPSKPGSSGTWQAAQPVAAKRLPPAASGFGSGVRMLRTKGGDEIRRSPAKAPGRHSGRSRRSARPCNRPQAPCSRRAETDAARSKARYPSRRRRRSAPRCSCFALSSRNGRARRLMMRGRPEMPSSSRSSGSACPSTASPSICSSSARPTSDGATRAETRVAGSSAPAHQLHVVGVALHRIGGGEEHDAPLRHHALHRLPLQEMAVERIGLAFRVAEAQRRSRGRQCVPPARR